MPDIWHLLQSAPDAIRLYDAARRAAQGDAEAVDFLKREGWWRGLEIAQPGWGSISQQVLHHVSGAYDAITNTLRGNVIEGEFRVLDREPWTSFIDWVKRQKWGTFAILGRKGGGKTMLALRLAQVWQRERGWPVYAVTTFPEDRYPFLQAMPSKRFVNEMSQVIKLIDPLPKDGEDYQEEDTAKVEKALHQFKRRIIVIDEMSLTVGSSGVDAGRILVRRMMAEARHMNWLIVYIGQLVRMFPQDLLNCEAIFAKPPKGREDLLDRQDAFTQDLWERVKAGFATVRDLPQWADFPTIEAWSYVDCQDMGNGRGYEGMMPSSMPDEGEEAEFVEVD